MLAMDARLLLSPSDLNHCVECPHLAAPALEVAQGERGHLAHDETRTGATTSSIRRRRPASSGPSP